MSGSACCWQLIGEVSDTALCRGADVTPRTSAASYSTCTLIKKDGLSPTLG